ncbi:GAF domain-containing protein [Hyalangium sp.]|uniref:GAF domain-containing protein n=1 Tax=Hyalangium sp. TaxID=2028555 RepID=UPI002D526AFC|nr:GAF domain-containing protein [Hyalangium sp.]HYH97914.1 GAF domain-containing protein [Hyalangium sp.]
MTAALQRLKDSRPGEVLEVVGEIVSQLMGCEEYVLLEVDAYGEHFVPASAMGLTAERLEALSVPQGIIGQVARHGVPYVIGRTSSVGAGAHEVGLTACIPLLMGRQVRGVLALFRMLPQKRGLTDEDLELLDLLRAQGAVAFSGPRRGALIQPGPAPAPPRGEPSALRTFYLEPGGVVSAVRPTEVTTILGSCVSVCLWDERLRQGGMNHFLLPTAPSGQPSNGRHGDAAIPMLVRELERLGSHRLNLRAKVFGGAHMAGPRPPGAAPPLGDRNAALARRLLGEVGISIIAEDLGGNAGRKLRFRTDDGTALVKTLRAG